MANFVDIQRQRGAEFLSSQPARVLDGFFRDLEAKIGGTPAILGLMAEYEARVTAQKLHASGGDKFPPRPLHLVAGGRR